MDRHRDYARVCHAMCRAINAAMTWQQVVESADALMHVHLRFRLLDEECRRHEQDNASTPAPPVEESEDANAP